MPYLLHKVRLMLKAKLWIVLLIIIEMATGVSFLVYSMNLFYSLDETRTAILEQNNDVEVKIYTNKGEDRAQGPAPFNLADYEYLKEIFHGDVIFYIKNKELCFYQGNMKEYNSYIVDFNSLGFDDTKVFLGSEVISNIVHKEDIEFFNKDVHYSEEEIRIGNAENGYISLDTQALTPDELDLLKKTIDKEMDDVSSIVYPMKVIPVFQLSEDFGSAYYNIHVKNADPKYLEGDILKASEYLHGKYSSLFRYHFIKPQANFEFTSEDIRRTERVVKMVGLSLLAIIFVGEALIFKMIYNKRRQSFAVSEAFGARRSTIWQEQFLEVFFVICIGSVTGIVIGSLLTPWLGADFIGRIALKGYAKTLINVLIMDVVMAVFTVLFINLKSGGQNLALRLQKK